jgi:hypothetical protein
LVNRPRPDAGPDPSIDAEAPFGAAGRISDMPNDWF